MFPFIKGSQEEKMKKIDLEGAVLVLGLGTLFFILFVVWLPYWLLKKKWITYEEQGGLCA